jgi:hypothetical protein
MVIPRTPTPDPVEEEIGNLSQEAIVSLARRQLLNDRVRAGFDDTTTGANHLLGLKQRHHQGREQDGHQERGRSLRSDRRCCRLHRKAQESQDHRLNRRLGSDLPLIPAERNLPPLGMTCGGTIIGVHLQHSRRIFLGADRYVFGKDVAIRSLQARRSQGRGVQAKETHGLARPSLRTIILLSTTGRRFIRFEAKFCV